MSTYEISKSSLLSLKAEILRKHEELSKTRAENEVKIKNLKKSAPLLKNKGVEQRQKQDISSEDEDLLKRSRAALEAKSKLYDKLSNRSTKFTEDEIEFNRRYLVRFDKKSKVSDLPPEYSEDDVDRYPESEEENIEDNYEPPKNPDEEWVEYVDCLGRTRTCLRKDLEHVKSRDEDLKSIVDSKKRNPERSRTPEPPPEPEPKPSEPEISEESELLSSDMRREILRRQWEKEEEELRNKSDIHYQDILFNEARTHGVGYYAFSKDEEKRMKQQEALKKLREETQAQQKKAQDLKAMRERQLAARIKAAKNRKRERLGLPPEEDEPEPTPVPEKPSEEKVEAVDETVEREKILEEKRKKHIRPWDKGKEGVKEHYEYTQEEWIDKKRKERHSEFAPPTIYGKDHKSRTKEREKLNKSSRTSQKESESTKLDDSRGRFEKSYKANESKPMKPVPIVNEVDDEEDTLLADYKIITGSFDNRGKGVEIAPPPTYEYYGPTASKKAKSSSTGNMGDSIEAGLKYIREQLEKKQFK